MYLIHTTQENFMLKILKDGKLKSSSKTKNVQLYGHKQGSKYIYLRLGLKKHYPIIIYNLNKLLLDNVFYLHIGWHAEPASKKIDGRKLTLLELDNLLNDFVNKVKKYYKKPFVDNDTKIPLMMSNEILIKNNINLNKYLKKIAIANHDKNIEKIIDEKYRNVKLMY